MRIAVESSSKIDSLDPNSSKFNYDNIDVFDKTESGYARVFNSNMDQPKRFRISQDVTTGKYGLYLGLNTNTHEGISETLIKFGNNVPDTIRAVIVIHGGNTRVSKVTMDRRRFSRRNSIPSLKTSSTSQNGLCLFEQQKSMHWTKFQDYALKISEKRWNTETLACVLPNMELGR